SIRILGTGAERMVELTPKADQFGTATITVTVRDAGNLTSSTTITVAVQPRADRPTVTPATTNVGTLSSGGLVISPNIVDGTSVTHFRISSISNGELFAADGITAIINGDVITTAVGATGLRFRPAAGLSSPTSSFGFQAAATTNPAEASIDSPTASAVITVDTSNLPPIVAVADTFTVTAGGTLIGNLLSNDTLPEAALPVTVAVTAAPASGTLQLEPDGRFTFRPGTSFAGTTFEATLTDRFGRTSAATVTIEAGVATPVFEAVLSEGDVDVGIAVEEGAFEPHIHDEEADLEYEPSAGLFHIRSIGATARSADAAFDFLGVNPGQTFWRLGQEPVGGLLFLGLGAEEIEPGVLVDDKLQVRFLSVSGPGHVSLWNNTDTGPEVLAASINGLNSADQFTLNSGSHTHYNWGFSSKGFYQVTLQFEAKLAETGEVLLSEPATYNFAVDPVNKRPSITVPSMSSLPYGTMIQFTGDRAISVADSDSGDRPITVTISTSHGGLTNPTIATDQSLESSRTLTGTVAEVNTALALMQLVPDIGREGAVAVTIGVTDGGLLVGSENAQSTERSTTFEYQTIPTAVLSITGPTSLNEDAVGFLTIRRSGGETRLPLMVDVRVSGTAGKADLSEFPATITFPANTTELTIPVRALTDALVEGNETLTVQVGQTATTSVTVVDTTPIPPPPPPPPQPKGFSIGLPGNGEVRQLAPDLTIRQRVFPLGTDLPSPIRVATMDLTGDGVPDIVAGVGPGTVANVAVTDGATGKSLANIRAFEMQFTGGVFVALGDLTGDGRPEVIVTPDEGGGPAVVVYQLMNGKLVEQQRFFGIDDPNFRGGARAALGDLNADGVADLVVSAGFGGGPRVAVYDGKSLGRTLQRLTPDFFAFESTLRNGSYPAVADFDGDGKMEVAFAAGPGGSPRVRVLDGRDLVQGSVVERASFFVGDDTARNGVRISASDLTNDKGEELVVGSADDDTLRIYSVQMPSAVLVQELMSLGSDDLPGGIFVG
ncbi:MAG: choice-of-anchor M domain-containing protein, partial [Gemmataceae bacterium]